MAFRSDTSLMVALSWPCRRHVARNETVSSESDFLAYQGVLIQCLSGCAIKETVLIILLLRAAGNQKCWGLLFTGFG